MSLLITSGNCETGVIVCRSPRISGWRRINGAVSVTAPRAAFKCWTETGMKRGLRLRKRALKCRLSFATPSDTLKAKDGDKQQKMHQLESTPTGQAPLRLHVGQCPYDSVRTCLCMVHVNVYAQVYMFNRLLHLWLQEVVTLQSVQCNKKSRKEIIVFVHFFQYNNIPDQGSTFFKVRINWINQIIGSAADKILFVDFFDTLCLKGHKRNALHYRPQWSISCFFKNPSTPTWPYWYRLCVCLI